MLFLVHKNWEKKSVNWFLGALRVLNWLFMVVGVLMAITILWILEKDEGDKVKYAFSKRKKRWHFREQSELWIWKRQVKFLKKHGLVLCLTSSFESYLQKTLKTIWIINRIL